MDTKLTIQDLADALRMAENSDQYRENFMWAAELIEKLRKEIIRLEDEHPWGQDKE